MRVLTVLLGLLSGAVIGWGEAASIIVLPARPAQGAPIYLRVQPNARLTALSGEWLGKRVYFNPEAAKAGEGRGAARGYSKAEHGTWFALAGVALDTAPGSYTLKLTGTDAAGHAFEASEVIRVAASRYPTVELKVAKQFTEPDEAAQKRIAQDQQVKHEAFERSRNSPDLPLRLWSGSFAAPIANTPSDGFGTRRVFNGKLQSQHQGLDFHAATGTPVHAVGRGRVLLARSLFFEGNCVMLDHGQGLISIYMHLSALKVKEGDIVVQGEPVGLSGATGRATGPHLHLAVRWQGLYLDPALLLKLELPQ